MSGTCTETVYGAIPGLPETAKADLERLCGEWDPSSMPPAEMKAMKAQGRIVSQAMEAAAAGRPEDYYSAKSRADDALKKLGGDGWNAYRSFVDSVWGHVDLGAMYEKAFNGELAKVQTAILLDPPMKKLFGVEVPDWKPGWTALKNAEFYLGLHPHAAELDAAFWQLKGRYATAFDYRCIRRYEELDTIYKAETCTEPVRHLYDCIQALDPVIRWHINPDRLKSIRGKCQK